MYSLFVDINDYKPLCVAETFAECALEAKKFLLQNNEVDILYIFSKDDGIIKSSSIKKEFAGIVNRNEVIEFRTKKAVHFEIIYKTVFDHYNTQFCFGPSIYSACDKLRDFHNKIISIKPVTTAEYYKKLDEPLPFGN